MLLQRQCTQTVGFARPPARRRRAVTNSYGAFSSPRVYQPRIRRGPYALLASGERHQNAIYPRPTKKTFDISFGAVLSTIPNTGFVSGSLNAIAGGTGENQRIGLKVTTSKINFCVAFSQGTTPVPCAIRFFLIYDKQSNGIPPIITDVLTSASTQAYMNLANSDRFTVLRQKYFSFSTNGDQTQYWVESVAINMTASYADMTADDPLTGSLYFVYVSDQAVVANQPRFTAYTRVRFFDN